MKMLGDVLKKSCCFNVRALNPSSLVSPFSKGVFRQGASQTGLWTLWLLPIFMVIDCAIVPFPGHSDVVVLASLISFSLYTEIAVWYDYLGFLGTLIAFVVVEILSLNSEFLTFSVALIIVFHLIIQKQVVKYFGRLLLPGDVCMISELLTWAFAQSVASLSKVIYADIPYTYMACFYTFLCVAVPLIMLKGKRALYAAIIAVPIGAFILMTFTVCAFEMSQYLWLSDLLLSLRVLLVVAWAGLTVAYHVLCKKIVSPDAHFRLYLLCLIPTYFIGLFSTLLLAQAGGVLIVYFLFRTVWDLHRMSAGATGPSSFSLLPGAEGKGEIGGHLTLTGATGFENLDYLISTTAVFVPLFSAVAMESEVTFIAIGMLSVSCGYLASEVYTKRRSDNKPLVKVVASFVAQSVVLGAWFLHTELLRHAFEAFDDPVNNIWEPVFSPHYAFPAALASSIALAYFELSPLLLPTIGAMTLSIAFMGLSFAFDALNAF